MISLRIKVKLMSEFYKVIEILQNEIKHAPEKFFSELTVRDRLYVLCIDKMGHFMAEKGICICTEWRRKNVKGNRMGSSIDLAFAEAVGTTIENLNPTHSQILFAVELKCGYMPKTTYNEISTDMKNALIKDAKKARKMRQSCPVLLLIINVTYYYIEEIRQYNENSLLACLIITPFPSFSNFLLLPDTFELLFV